MTFLSTPEKKIAKAGKSVGKALSVFENAAAKLEQSSAELLAVAETLDEQAGDLLSLADRSYDDNVVTAQVAYDAAVKAAEDAYDSAVNTANAVATLLEEDADTLIARAVETENAAFHAQAQADNVRSLLKVA